MPVISVTNENPFEDGRQSERALMIRSGVERYFRRLGWVTLPELTLDNGRRADLVALSAKGDLQIVEIKSSVADLKADSKWPDYRDWCDELYFATLSDVPAEIFPADAGFIVADAYGAEPVRDAPEHRLAAARRKKMHLAFARACASRLERLCAHAGVDASTLVDDDPSSKG